MTPLTTLFDQLSILMVGWMVRVLPEAAGPFHPSCGGVKPFKPAVIQIVDWGLGIVDTIAIIYALFLIGAWMFSSKSLHLKRIAFIVIGLILINGVLIQFFGAFGFHASCL